MSGVFRLGRVAGVGAIAGGVAAGFSAVDIGNLMLNQSAFAGEFQSPITLPRDLLRNNEEVPFISMQFERYQRRSINEQPFYSEVMRIRLPIPENLVENTRLNYQNEALGSAFGALTNAGAGATNSSGGINEVLNRIGGVASGVGVSALASLPAVAAAATGASQQAVGTVQSLTQSATSALSVLSGISANPFQVVLFKSPEFRSHRFAWKFVPNDPTETEILNQLINTFKYHALPGISSFGSVFFSYPEILQIKFRPTDQYLYKFKPCVVTGVIVNYAPNGPSFVRGTRAPTAVTLEIQLQEIEIMTKADFLRDASTGNWTVPQQVRAEPAPRTIAEGGAE